MSGWAREWDDLWAAWAVLRDVRGSTAWDADSLDRCLTERLNRAAANGSGLACTLLRNLRTIR